MKKKRQQERDGQRLDARDEIAADHAARHRSAHDECAEDRVQADQIREPRAERHEREAHDEPGLGECAVFLQQRTGAGEQRTDDEEREGNVARAAADVHPRVGPVVVEAGEHHGEQAPRGGVVERARAERHGAHRGAREFFEMDDPREHRERGDAHRRAEEEHGLGELRPLRKELRVMEEHPRQPCAEHERHDHPRRRHRDGAAQPLAHDVHAEFHPDHEHVEREAELRRGEEIALRVARGLRLVPWENPRLRLRPQQSEKRRPQQHARDHLRDDLRLAEAPRDGTDQPAEKQDDGDLEEELNGKMQVVHVRGGRDNRQGACNGNTTSRLL